MSDGNVETEHPYKAWTDGLRQLAEIIRDAKTANWLAVANVLHHSADDIDHLALTTAQAEIEALKPEAETARYMREIAQGLGYPSTLEALEDIEALRARVEELEGALKPFCDFAHLEDRPGVMLEFNDFRDESGKSFFALARAILGAKP